MPLDAKTPEAAAPTARQRWVSRSAYLLFGLVLVVCLCATLQTVAFQPKGATAAYLENQAIRYAQASITWPADGSSGFDPAEPVESIKVDIWFLPAPQVFYAPTIFATRLERGLTADGQVAYYVEYDEAGLNSYLNYWFSEWARQNAQLQNTQVEVVPGGLIIYGDVNLGVSWQRIGAVFTLDESGRQFAFTGVDVGGQLLDLPPSGPIAHGIEALESDGNRALREFRIIDPEGELSIQQIVLLENIARVIIY